MRSVDRAVIREWEALCKTAQLHPSVMWNATTLYRRLIRNTGQILVEESALIRLRERRPRAHVCGCKRTAQLALNY